MSAAAPSRPPRRVITDDALEVVTNWLRIVAEPTRVRIMCLLDEHGGTTVQQLCDSLPTTHQNVSKHLGVLYAAGLVSRVRDGNTMRYELADWTALWMVDQIVAQVATDTSA